MALFGFGRPRPCDETRRRVAAWAREAITSAGGPDATLVKVNEIACPDPACPGFETVILAIKAGQPTQAFKIAKPLAEVTEADVTLALRPA